MLTIRLLGKMEVVRDGKVLALPPSRKTRALLAYLVLSSKALRRDRLSTLFWDVPEDPKGALRWSLSKLRSILDEPECARILADRDTVTFERCGAYIDLVDAGARLDTGSTQDHFEALARLFRGEFLEGLSLPDQHEFEAWRIAVHEEARVLHRRVLTKLVAACADTPGVATVHAREAVRLDPGDHAGHIALLRLLSGARQRAAAEEQYALSLRQLEAAGATTAPLVFAWRDMSRQTGSTPTVTEFADTKTDKAADPVSPPPDHSARQVIAASPDDERKFATIVAAFVHRTGTKDPETDPEAVSQSEDALARAARVIARHAGFLIGITDGMMLAVFGAPRSTEDHSVQACRAALGLRAALREDSHGALDLTICVDSGEILVRAGSLGPVATGFPLRRATLATHALPNGTIAASPNVKDRCGGFFRFRRLEPILASGLPEPVALHALVGATALRTRWDVIEARGLEVFFGRADELATLKAAARMAAEGRGQVVALVGEAGIGKSRLAHRFARALLDAGWVLRSCAAASHETGAFMLIRDLLRSWLGVADSVPPQTASQSLRHSLETIDPNLLDILSPLAWLLDVPVEDGASWEQLGPPQRRRRLLEAVATLATAQTASGPVIILVEDLHWADAESLAVLDRLVGILPSLRLLLLVTYRPDIHDAWANRSSYRLCRLGPMAPSEAGLLLDGLLGSAVSLQPLKARLIEQSEANPFFLEELARALVETGSLAGEPGDYRTTGPLPELVLPETVQDVLAARIDRLDTLAKRLLQTASVLGRIVPHKLLMAVWADEQDPHDALARLAAAELLYQTKFIPDVEYTFRHALTRQVAYGSLTRARRAALHAAAAAAMERIWSDNLDAVIETVADHWEAGERGDRAADSLLRAARRAKDRHGLEQARLLGERALAAAKQGSEIEKRVADALALLGDLAGLKGDVEQANTHYVAALAAETDLARRRAIANRIHEPHLLTRAGGHIAWYEHGSGDRTLVFVHPFLYGLAVFQPLVERLCQEFRIVTIDPRGTGNSSAIPPDYGMHDHMEDVRAVIEAVAPAGKVIGIGLSRGALTLIRLAALHPSLLDRMILVGGFIRQTVGLGAPFTDATHDVVREMTAAIEAGDMRQASELFAPTIYSEPGTEELRQMFIDQCASLPPETVARFWTLDPENDVEALLERVTVPTLLAHGADDQDTPVAIAHALAARIPGAGLHVFEGKGHLPLFTATNEFCTMLRAFVMGGAPAEVPPPGNLPVSKADTSRF